MDKFTKEEMTVILEIATQHLSNTDDYLGIADYLDLSDEFLDALHDKMTKELHTE